jgi:hypothetical protein
MGIRKCEKSISRYVRGKEAERMAHHPGHQEVSTYESSKLSIILEF